MIQLRYFLSVFFVGLFWSCQKIASMKTTNITIVETSASGNKLTPVQPLEQTSSENLIRIDTTQKKQTITGIGGAFTESSAHLLNQLSKENRKKVLEAYFSRQGANYSLARTHMNSCDFSLSNYSYAPVEGDKQLENFSIQEDKDDLIPMIQEAMAISEDGFKLFASPWTAPPWMKDNNSYVGGKLLPDYYDTWALFFSKYVSAYAAEGIPIWGFTVVNEPHGNGNNWESMLFTPKEMTDFVSQYLGPHLEEAGMGDKVILGYDQNREGVREWVDEMYKDEASAKYYGGTAVHWYESTYEVFPEELQYAKSKAPNKHLMQTEGCIDSEVPKWQDDAWYWSKEATDWGWDWESAERKYLHPKYVPVYRYVRDIIGCLNNQVDGWVDWNMVLDEKGGPNWAENWCVAPVLVDTAKDEVYFTPIYYAMAHFSKYFRPGAKVLEVQKVDKDLQVTAAKNTDGSVVVAVFNPTEKSKAFTLEMGEIKSTIVINAQAVQTVSIQK